jgi:NADH-quinone oxidoreductase subunit N
MTHLLAAAAVRAPVIDWPTFSPIIALTAGGCVVLLAGLLRSPAMRRHGVPVLALLTLAVTIGLSIWQWGENKTIVDGALAMDDLTRALTMFFCAGAAGAVLMSWREAAVTEAGEGEYFTLMLMSVLGMVVLVAAANLVVIFIGFELLSIPLYVLCATRIRREHSLESGLKYLIIGSVGSATLLYGLALVYGAIGDTSLAAVAAHTEAVRTDTLLLTGIALIVAGLAFKASVAPFHQWTPDVYEGAPTPITGFMAVATKAAAFGVLLRLFDVGLIDAATIWGPAMAVLAAITIVVGNVGAIGQSSLKRMLAYSSVAQAGYMLAGVVVSTRLGVSATVFYLAAYLLMNLAAFAVIAVRERESGLGDDIASLYGTGATRPWLAWTMTISMLALAGFPATMGFFGKLYLIEATVDNGYAWLGVFIVLGSAVSLAYYLRVIAAVWMRSPEDAASRLAALRAAGGAGALGPGGGDGGSRPIMAGGSPEADEEGAGGPGSRAWRRAAGAEGGGRDVRAEATLEDDEPGASAADSPAGEGPIGLRIRQPEVLAVAVLCAAATVFFGIYPSPLFDVARDAGAALANLV